MIDNHSYEISVSAQSAAGAWGELKTGVPWFSGTSHQDYALAPSGDVNSRVIADLTQAYLLEVETTLPGTLAAVFDRDNNGSLWSVPDETTHAGWSQTHHFFNIDLKRLQSGDNTFHFEGKTSDGSSTLPTPGKGYILVKGTPKLGSPIAIDITSDQVTVSYIIFPKVDNKVDVTFKQASGSAGTSIVGSVLAPTCKDAEAGRGVDCAAKFNISDLANSSALQAALKASGSVPLLFTVSSSDGSTIGTLQTTAYRAPSVVDPKSLQDATTLAQNTKQMGKPEVQTQVKDLVTRAFGYDPKASDTVKQATNQDNVVKSVTSLLQASAGKNKASASDTVTNIFSVLLKVAAGVLIK